MSPAFLWGFAGGGGWEALESWRCVWYNDCKLRFAFQKKAAVFIIRS